MQTRTFRRNKQTLDTDRAYVCGREVKIHWQGPLIVPQWHHLLVKWFCRGLVFFTWQQVFGRRRFHVSAVFVEEDVLGENPPSCDECQLRACVYSKRVLDLNTLFNLPLRVAFMMILLFLHVVLVNNAGDGLFVIVTKFIKKKFFSKISTATVPSIPKPLILDGSDPQIKNFWELTSFSISLIKNQS